MVSFYLTFGNFRINSMNFMAHFASRTSIEMRLFGGDFQTLCKGIKMGTTGFTTVTKEKKPKEKSTLGPDLFDSSLGFEPLVQTEKPEITIVRLSDYSQVKPKENEDLVEMASSTQGRVIAETRDAFFLQIVKLRHFFSLTNLNFRAKNNMVQL